MRLDWLISVDDHILEPPERLAGPGPGPRPRPRTPDGAGPERRGLGLRGELTTPVPDTHVTNICFGGPDGRTAFICSAGRGILYSTRWPWPGLRLNFAR